MASERLYSNLVSWLKILLPLVALGILTSVVFFARENEEARRIPLAIGEDDSFLRERIGQPEYLALLSGGATLRVTAKTVVPEEGRVEVYLADAVAGRIVEPTGRIIQVTAPEGRLDVNGNLADLLGIVSVDTSDGYHLLTEDLMARTDTAFAESGGPVWGEAPFGRIEADLMRYGAPALIGGGGPPDAPPVLHFTGRVKVIYDPKD